MREMKDSRIEWIGQIPSTWRINKGKYFISLLNKPARETDEIITCFRDGEVTLRSNRREDGFTVSLTETGYQGIDVGDLIVHGMDGFAGAIGISDSRGKATPVLNVLNTTECKKYIMYLMRSMAYCGLFLSLSTGIRVRTCDTNWKKLREIDYLLPDLLEQQNIANFLDAKCAEIDALAADIQTQIDTLEQYKRSVITEAITKGLNPDVEMACHQISWIEQMPAHWKIIPSKYLFHNSDKRKCEGDQQLTASQKHGIITQQEYMERENSKIVFANQGLENWKHVEPYDFVISLRSFQGGLEMSETTGCITWHYVVLKANKEQRLSEIIDEINSRTGKSYDNDVVVKAMLQIRDILMKSDKLKTSAKNNTQKDFEFSYFDDIDDALIEGLSQNQDFFSLLLSNDEMKRQVLGIFSDEIYRSLRNAN